MIRSVALALGFVAVLAAAPAAQAEPSVLSAPDAYTASVQGDVVILDIRTPDEWRETGVAEGALAVTMHSPAFAAQLQTILERNPNSRIALICATGGRSKYVTDVLERNGIKNVVDVSEGMFGNGTDPGWIARGLPITDALNAIRAAEATLK